MKARMAPTPSGIECTTHHFTQGAGAIGRTYARNQSQYNARTVWKIRQTDQENGLLVAGGTGLTSTF